MTGHHFGGPDTGRKLRCLQEYLQAYAVALQNQEFAYVYIDAFAGSGSRTETRAALPLFDGPEANLEEITTPGSARIALEIDPPFHSIVLIEQDEVRFKELEKLKEEYGDERGIVLRNGDANQLVKRLCKGTSWRKRTNGRRGIRGVIFLDPYGMEVAWDTVEAIAATQALDCWYFFPLSGLYRNAPLNPAKLDAGKQASLDRVLGASDWRQRWYEHDIQPTGLFEDADEAVRRTDIDAIEAYVKERLGTAFRGAVLDPVRLYHRNGAPLASLFFAISNPSEAAVKVATRIASHILNAGKLSQRRSR